jgi:hypothetical protein
MSDEFVPAYGSRRCDQCGEMLFYMYRNDGYRNLQLREANGRQHVCIEDTR